MPPLAGKKKSWAQKRRQARRAAMWANKEKAESDAVWAAAGVMAGMLQDGGAAQAGGVAANGEAAAGAMAGAVQAGEAAAGAVAEAMLAGGATAGSMARVGQETSWGLTSADGGGQRWPRRWWRQC